MSFIEIPIPAVEGAGIAPSLEAKWRLLLSELASLDSAVIAYSGGVDSGFLAYVASRVLGDRAIAITIASSIDSAHTYQAATDFAERHGIAHETLTSDPLQHPDVRANRPDRCYHCKMAILRLLWAYAKERGFSVVIEGQNADDRADYRPGRRAVEETGTLSPLVRSGLAKAEIRQLARAFGLSIWDQPSSPCLATRIPYGIELTEAKLTQVGLAEDYLHDRGFKIVRVRHHGDVARIEVQPDQIQALLELREDVLRRFKQLGFHHTALDLQGYRMGSMNEGVVL